MCGHRFLVPAPEVRQTPAPPPLHAPSEPPISRSPAAAPRRTAQQPPSVRAARPAASPTARPSPPMQEREMVAEVVYPGDSAEVLPAAEIVAPAPYAEPLGAIPAAYESPLAPARRATRSNTVSSELFRLWAGRVMLFVLVPLATLCVLFGHLQIHRSGGIILNAQRALPTAARLRTPPAPLPGTLLTITSASGPSRSSNVEFRVRFTHFGFVPQPSDRYIWIVSSQQGNIEFPVAHTALTGGGSLTGKPSGSLAARFRSPMTTWIESQPAGSTTRQRVSNVYKF